MPTPREIADAQLITYNNCDIDGYCALFHDDADLVMLPAGTVICTGLPAIRARYTERFATPGLHCEVSNRYEIGNTAVDVETVFADGRDPERIIALYTVTDGKIARISFLREG